jgi:HAD superfamily hydrolase (TIGR01549 family)
MLKIISFDVDATLVDPSFADNVWLEGVPTLYAEKHGIDFDTAKRIVIKEYERIGEEDIRWYQLDYWFDCFQLGDSPRNLLKKYKDTIRVYEEVPHVLNRLSRKYILIVASNAHKDFLSLTFSSIKPYFDYIFSSTSDFSQVRKYEDFYREILRQLKVNPSEAAHIGDHYKFDYVIPARVGMHAFFLDRTGGKGLRNLNEFEEKIIELENY